MSIEVALDGPPPEKVTADTGLPLPSSGCS
jgi:hypothetical protein